MNVIVILIAIVMTIPQEEIKQVAIWHLRKPDGYGIRKHSISEDIGKDGSIKESVLPVFSVDLSKHVFEDRKKWDGKNDRRLEISMELANRATRRILAEGEVLITRPRLKWEVERMYLQSIDEESGDYVWVALIVLSRTGNSTFQPRFPIYLDFAGEYLPAFPIEKDDKLFRTYFIEKEKE